MRKQVRVGKHLIVKFTAFVLVCCLVMGSVCTPIFAEEKIEESGNCEDTGEVRKDKEAVDTGKDAEVSEKGKEVTDTGKDAEVSEKNKETTGTDKDAEASEKDKEVTDAGKDAEVSEKDKETTDAGKDAEVSEKDKEVTDAGKDAEVSEKDNEEPKNEEGGSGTDNDTEKEESGDTKKDTVSGNDTEIVEKADREESEKDTVSGNDIGETAREEQEIIDVVVPTTYTLALNPYRLPIITGEDETTTEQIVSGNYGIVNKSSTDLVVTVSLTVEDRSGESLVFVDSAEEAEDAGMDVYAIYLAAVPADEGKILIGDGPVDGDVTAVSLRDVSMTGAAEQAVALHAGDNGIAFKLTGADYAWETGEGSTEETVGGEMDREGEAVTQTGEQAGEEREEYVFQGLAADGRGVTAYTFYGVMNPDAEWERLSGGIRLSVVYTYQIAEGDEEIVEGTGAMIRTEEEPLGEE